MSDVTLTIDGREVTNTAGTALLEAALGAGIEIPHLCYDPRLQAYGACRMCLVEVEGTADPVASCTTEVESGMVVHTRTERLRELRRTLVELMLYDHPRDCLTCANTGTCRLQDLAYELGIEDFQPIERERRTIIEDPGNAVIFRDPAKCILCGKCVRVCEEHQMVGVLEFADRGLATQVIPARGGLGWDTDCELCGQCVDVCPAGALMVRAALEKGREKDFEKVRSVCPYCGVGCSVKLNVLDDEVVMVTADAEAVPNYGNLCVKGRFQFEFIGSPDRLQRPLVRREGELVETSWDEALDEVASRLRAIHEEHGPGSVGFVSSCRCTNEENYLMQKLARAAFGTHNVDQCARTCHAPTVAGLSMSFGSGAMTNSIGEIQHCDVLLIIGSNTTEAHPVIALEMKKAHRRGARIIVVDPRRIGMTEYACLHLPVRPGTDVALLNCMMNVIIEEGWADEEFIAARPEGYEELKETVGRYEVDEVAELCAVPADDIREAARIYATGEKSAIFYTLGLTEHICGTD
ncbi:MAG: molybdopterin-dependent oxidoreductase, partial [Armatimonadota bacterium]